MARVFLTEDKNNTSATNDFARPTNSLDRRANFHINNLYYFSIVLIEDSIRNSFLVDNALEHLHIVQRKVAPGLV